MNKLFTSPEFKLLKIPLDNTFPLYIRSNKEILSDWIL
jgi:hypothetical protein